MTDLAAAPAEAPRRQASRYPRLTAHQEHFARLVVEGFSQSEAFRRSYTVKPETKNTTVWVTSCKIAKNPKVLQRINELRAEAATRSIVSREALLDEMGINRAHALDTGRLNVAATSTRDRARLAGYLGGTGAPPGKQDEAMVAVAEGVTSEERTMFEIARRMAFALELARRRVNPPEQRAINATRRENDNATHPINATGDA